MNSYLNLNLNLDLAGASNESIKALQVMQLTLQYLVYSQKILQQKIQATQIYMTEQRKQVENCKEIRKKQKEKLKKLEKYIDKLNEEELHYESMARKTCPWILENKNIVLKSLLEGDQKVLQDAKKGDTMFQQIEDYHRDKLYTKEILKEPKKNIRDPEDNPIIDEIPQKIPEETKQVHDKKPPKNLTIDQREDLNIAPPLKKPLETAKELEYSSSEKEVSLSLYLSQSGVQSNIPSSGRVYNQLNITQNQEANISKRESQLNSYSAAGPSNDKHDEIKEEIGEN